MELMGDVITAFLQIIDGFRPCGGVQTILATNRPYVIDNAIMSRFPAMGWIKFSLPDLILRKEIALQKLQVIGHNGLVDVGTGKERDGLAGYISKATEGYSGRGMHNLSMALNAQAVGWYIRNSKAIPRIREPEIDAAVRKAADYENKIKGEL